MEGQTDLKYSIVFLNYDPDKIKDWTEGTLKAIKDCSGGYNYELIEVNDVKGYVNAVNEGIKRSTGDYIVICNDDIIVSDFNWLTKLTNFNGIVSFTTHPFYMTGQEMPDGSCWMFPRALYDEIGLLDTIYQDGYGCDEIDWFYRAKQVGYDLLSVPCNITHMQNKTYTSAYFVKDKEAMTAKNANYFYEKWHKVMTLNQ